VRLERQSGCGCNRETSKIIGIFVAYFFDEKNLKRVLENQQLLTILAAPRHLVNLTSCQKSLSMRRGENLYVPWCEFSTISWVVLVLLHGKCMSFTQRLLDLKTQPSLCVK
jgi:hypothetical protein